MSSIGMSTLTNLVGVLLTQLPLLIVWVVGLVLAIARWGRHPRASAYLVAGLVIVMLSGLAGAALSAAAPWLAATRTPVRIAILMGIANIARSVISAVAWGLVLAAVFADRAR